MGCGGILWVSQGCWEGRRAPGSKFKHSKCKTDGAQLTEDLSWNTSELMLLLLLHSSGHDGKGVVFG